jgi:hypothetical protein
MNNTLLFIPFILFYFMTIGTRAIGMELAQDNIEAAEAESADGTMAALAIAKPQEIDRVALQKAFRTAKYMSWAMTLVLLILIPMPMFGAEYIFSTGFFTGMYCIYICTYTYIYLT